MMGAKCVNEVMRVILESEIDPQVDAVFYKACAPAITEHCPQELAMNRYHHRTGHPPPR